MKDNNGFTLIEMIGIIILLTVIMLVVAPTMISTLKNSNTKRFNAFKDNLKIAAENYIVDNKKTSLTSVQIKLQDLLELNYIEEIPKIPAEDPLADDGEKQLPSDAYVLATKTSSGYNYKLCKTSSNCESI